MEYTKIKNTQKKNLEEVQKNNEGTRRELIKVRSKLKKVYKIRTEEWKESKWKKLKRK